MEEHNEVHSEENKAPSEKNKKRQLKTPAQVSALEEFYDANKYPSEEMKSQLAEQIGLTEKQVSGWFCHRRLKDKRLARDEGHGNGRQDRSSGVVQDRVSGLKQDSCGSTKQGDFRHVDPREVESRRFNGQHFPAAENAFELRSDYTGKFSGDDTSSESSSSLHGGLNSQRVDPYNMGTSKYSMHNGVAIPNHANCAKNTGYKPAGYLKVKVDIGNVAITAVKRQLGRNYREDGPPLGVAFQPLPPGAFEPSIRESVQEPCDAMDQALLCSPDTSASRKQPRLGTRYGVPDLQIGSQELHAEGTNMSNINGSDNLDSISRHRMKQKSSILGHGNAFPGRNTFDKYEDSVGEAPVFNSRKNDGKTSKLGVDGMRSHSVSNHPPRPYGAKFARERTEAWLQESDSVSPKVTEWNKYMKSQPSNAVPRRNESLDTDKRGISRRMEKEERLHVEKKARKEYDDPIRGTMHPTSELVVSKRARDEPEQRDIPLIASFPESPYQPNQTKGSVLEMPSSFSEDETAETSSSLN